MILLVIAPWPFASHGSSDNWRAFFCRDSTNQLGSGWNRGAFLKVLLLVALCIVLFLLCYFYPTIRQWQDESLGGKMVEHVAWFACLFQNMCPKQAVHGTELYEEGWWERLKKEAFIFSCTCTFRNLRRDIDGIYVSNLLRPTQWYYIW